MQCTALENCKLTARSIKSGVCDGHYRQRKNGKEFTPLRSSLDGRPRIKNVGNCDNGCNRPKRCRGLCSHCYAKVQWARTGRARVGAKPHNLKPLGYTYVDPISGYVYVKTCMTPSTFEKQHRYVMEQFLKRKLLPGENVHHINGIKYDNDISNLELWTTSQPPGQRVEDKIEWAKEFLKQYGFRIEDNKHNI